MSIATTLYRSREGQSIAHAKALPGNPFDGQKLEIWIPDIERQIAVGDQPTH